MPKRKDKESDDYILRKIRKLEKKLKKRARLSSSSSENSQPMASLNGDTQQEQSVDVPIDTISIVDEHIKQNVETEEPSPTTDLQLQPTEVAGSSLNENILQLLGDTPSKNKKYSPPIQNELAVRWEHIAINGLPKALKKELLEKYFIPENCVNIGSPQLNPEIKAAMSEALVKKDKAIELKQQQHALAISCVSQALTRMFNVENKDDEVIKYLIDASKLLCDAQFVESMSRRSFVASTIKKDIKDHLYATEIDTFLFGEKLAETLKAAKAINKSGTELKTTQTKPAVSNQPRYNQPRNSLNGRPPTPSARQVGAPRRLPVATAPPRRYQAQAPPQTPRFAPPPPQPPPHSRGRPQARR